MGRARSPLKVVQGTKGGPVGSEAVTIKYYNAQGEVVAKTSGKLGDKADFTVRDVPLEIPVSRWSPLLIQALLTGSRAVSWTAQTPEQDIELGIYETTEQEPAWDVAACGM